MKASDEVLLAAPSCMALCGATAHVRRTAQSSLGPKTQWRDTVFRDALEHGAVKKD
jgi:hypothetical protein